MIFEGTARGAGRVFVEVERLLDLGDEPLRNVADDLLNPRIARGVADAIGRLSIIVGRRLIPAGLLGANDAAFLFDSVLVVVLPAAEPGIDVFVLPRRPAPPPAPPPGPAPNAPRGPPSGAAASRSSPA